MRSAIIVRAILALVLSVAWEIVRLVNGANWSWEAVIWRAIVAFVALAVAAWVASQRRLWLTAVVGGLLVAVVAGWLGLNNADTRLAWLATLGLLLPLLAVESGFARNARDRGGRLARLEYGLGLLLLASIGGVALGLIAQVESQFAEEEFFVPLQIAFLGLFSLLLLLAHATARRFARSPDTQSVNLRPIWGIGVVLLCITLLAWWGARAYQRSFFSANAPSYPGISEAVPFLCTAVTPAPGSPSGEDVFERIIDAVADSSDKDTADFGMLALSTGEAQWAEAFRDAVMTEAEGGTFTEPANSVKYGQRLAARRAYYYSRVREAFPDLFSRSEQALVEDWFGVINRRATTVEWVDLLYGLAFSVRPEGPYENQETGAGLLALLEANGLGDDALAETNQDYLARNVRGWAERFRNTDDAYAYQAEWVDNALFQELYQGVGGDAEAFEHNRHLAFEWLLLQALPGGGALGYNRPGTTSMATALYLGALLLSDPRHIWLADRALDHPDSDSAGLRAQPGLEQATSLAGTAPTEGSCLLFSPTGLPTQVGPLGPDKVVLRDGWDEDATYLLLNLRFTGWHRYKATNAITLLYQKEPILVEDTAGEPTSWLPVGRSHFRDKRIPRENLNGLQIPRSGFSRVAYDLTGMNGPWAQDPPHHARVDDFSNLGTLDASRTTIEDWRGWHHQRSVYFVHNGPIIIVDEARGSKGGRGAITWHAPEMGEATNVGVWLREGQDSVFLAMSEESWTATEFGRVETPEHGAVGQLRYDAPESGQVDLVTAFLMNGWETAEPEINQVLQGGELAGQSVRLETGEGAVHLLHRRSDWTPQNGGSALLSSDGLATDGLAALAFGVDPRRPSQLCLIRGTQADLGGIDEPAGLRSVTDEQDLSRRNQWEWEAGTLTVQSPVPTSACYAVTY